MTIEDCIGILLEIAKQYKEYISEYDKKVLETIKNKIEEENKVNE